MKRVKWFLLLGVLLFIFTALYTKYTYDRVVGEVRDYLENNVFMQYSLSEYRDWFSTNGYAVESVVGDAYLIKYAQYESIEDYSKNSFDIYARKDEALVSLEYNESNDGSYKFGMYKIKAIDDEGLPFIYDVEWDDTYQEVKRKIGLNIINTCFHKLGIVVNGPIRCGIMDENGPLISLVITNTDSTFYNYAFYFDEFDQLEEIVILTNIKKHQ